MKTVGLKYAAWSISLLSLLIALPAKAADLAYAGRLVDSEGAPLVGPVDITLRFYGSAAGSDQLGATKTFDGVALDGGVFQLTVSLEAQDQAAIFGDGTAVVFVEIEAAGKLYPRQRFTPVPLALRIPVDNDSLVYGPDAKLAVGEIAIGQVQGLQAALAQKLDSTPASASASGFLSSADWTTFNAKQAAITASSSLTAGSIATANQDAVVIKPYGTQAGETGELRFEEKAGNNYVGFKAPDTLAANKVWTLPAADGVAGEVLSTDGAGGLSWVALSGANILDATITDAKLQTITTAGKVSGAAITSGTIGGSATFAGTGGVTTSGNITLSPASSVATELRFQDDDASNYVAFKAPSTVGSNLVLTLPAADGAAGQFLKTDGAGTLAWDSPSGAGDMLKSANLSDLANVATARGNLGLGALATLSAVGSGEITNGSVVDADISASAAIVTSKLSGALTAVAGHGLGSLATASSVTSAEITDSTIVNADISASAAIATSKLSGAITSIAGHGLGSLASLSSVTAAEIGDGEIADADISASAAIATSKLSGPLTAVSGHGLGTLAALSAVSSTEITNGTIVDADISGTAAIATSKLSGTLTAISGHGLGALATLTTVSTSEITDGTIANADISGTAAIATSKLSGALTAVTGHGLGALAALSTVSAAEITDGTIVDADISTTASIDSSKIANGSVSSTEFQYLDGVTSSIQPQLDAKASAASPNFTGAIASALGNAAAPSYSFTSDSNTGVWSSGSDTVNVSTGGSERIRVTSAGNVGIGTTSPSGLLHVASSGTTSPIAATAVFGNTATTYGLSDTVVGANLMFAGTGRYNGWLTYYPSRADGKPYFRMESSSSTYADSPVGLLVSGNVGIGTTVPGQKLSVAGTVESTSGGFKFPDGTTQTSAAASIAGITNLTDGAAISWNASIGNVFAVTLGGNRFLTNPSNLTAGRVYVLMVIQDATGGRTLSFDTNYRFPGGAPVPLATSANATDVLTFLSDGTLMYLVSAGRDQLAATRTSCRDVLLSSPVAPSGIYAVNPGSGDFNVYCDMQTDGGGWTLVYKHSSDVANDPYTLWDVTTTAQTVPPKKHTKDTVDYVSRAMIDTYRATLFSQARVEIWAGGLLKSFVTFNMNGSDKYSWFAKDRIISTSYSDISASSQNFFSLSGDTSSGVKRRFFISKLYNGCPGDTAWFTIFGMADACGSNWSVNAAFKVAYCDTAIACLASSSSFKEGDSIVVLMR